MFIVVNCDTLWASYSRSLDLGQNGGIEGYPLGPFPSSISTQGLPLPPSKSPPWLSPLQPCRQQVLQTRIRESGADSDEPALPVRRTGVNATTPSTDRLHNLGDSKNRPRHVATKDRLLMMSNLYRGNSGFCPPVYRCPP